MLFRRIFFVVLWFLSLWFLLASGKPLFIALFFVISLLAFCSALQLFLMLLSFRLQVRIQAEEIEKGDPAQLVLTPSTRFFPIVNVNILMEIPDLYTNAAQKAAAPVCLSFAQSSQIPLTLLPYYADIYNIKINKIVFRDLLGLWQLKVSGEKYLDSCYYSYSLLPRGDLPLPLHKTGNTGKDSPKYSYEATELSGIRHYRQGDPLRSIHWKQSARLGKWQVKEYENNSEPIPLLYLDMATGDAQGLSLPQQDALLEAAASYGRLRLEQGHSFVLWCPNREKLGALISFDGIGQYKNFRKELMSYCTPAESTLRWREEFLAILSSNTFTPSLFCTVASTRNSFLGKIQEAMYTGSGLLYLLPTDSDQSIPKSEDLFPFEVFSIPTTEREVE